MKPSSIKADIELQSFLKGKIFSVNGEGDSVEVAIYTDGERSGIDVPDDFIDVMYAGGIRTVDIPMSFIKGYLTVSLYVRLNPDNTIKKNRVEKILSQFDEIVNRHSSNHYYYEYTKEDFLTPTTAYTAIGYSMTTLYLKWHTK